MLNHIPDQIFLLVTGTAEGSADDDCGQLRVPPVYRRMATCPSDICRTRTQPGPRTTPILPVYV
jgi:hypothetical protein